MKRTIKTSALSILSFLFVIFVWQYQSAQCTNCTADGPLNSLSYSTPAYAPDWTTVQTNAAEGRDYMLFNVTKGQIYRWSTYGIEDNNPGINVPCLNTAECATGLVCEGLDGDKHCELAFDTELTLLKGNCGLTGTLLAYNRNAVFRNQSQIEWKADFDGTVFLLVNYYKCDSSCDQDGLNCMKTSVKWQRIDSTHCTDCSYQYPTTYPVQTPAAAFASPVMSPSWTTTANNNLKAGEFQVFDVVKGRVYRWSTCSDTSYDTQLTLYRGEADEGLCGTFLAYGDDSEESPCADGSKQTVLKWTADYTGKVTVLNNEYNCGYCNKSPNPTNPWGHCSLTTLEWQRYDCNTCLSAKGPYDPTGTVQSLNNIDHGDYIKFNLKKGVKYRFRSTAADGSSTFTGMMTLRASSGTACSNETLAQSEKAAGSYEHELVYTATSNFTAELLVSGAHCGTVGSKKATITYVELYDPTARFIDDFSDGSFGGSTIPPKPPCCDWTGVTLDTLTGLVIVDNNVYKETWAEAMTYCEDYEYTIPGSEGSGGDKVDDWILPNINQLYSIVDFEIYDKATSYRLPSYITSTAGEGANCTLLTQESTCSYPNYICGDKQKCVRNNWYWSGTSVVDSAYFSWGVNMKDGRSYRVIKEDHSGTPATKHKVICIRGASVSGELDIYRPARERVFSGWACDKNHINQAIKIYFVIRDKNGNNIVDMSDYQNNVIEKIPGRSTWSFIYGDTNIFPAAGSAKETKINANCGGTAQTKEHAFELDLKGSSSLATTIKNKLSGKSAPYYVTAFAGNYKIGWTPAGSFVLSPENEVFVLSDVCGDNIRTVGEQCDDGNSSTEKCPYNTSCMVCDSVCQWVAGYSPYCGDTVLDVPDENCDCGPGYWTLTGTTCTTSLGSKRCPGYGDGTGSCTICNEICQAEILTIPFCGDGFKDSVEACDDGDLSNNNSCKTDCTSNTCGDGYIFNSGAGANETCDDGPKNGYYETACDPGPCCNNTCNGPGPKCGDSILQRANCTGYPGCVTVSAANETCDKGADNGDWKTLTEHNLDVGCNGTCTGPAPYCGDGTLQSLFEVCDDGAANQDGVYGKCRTDCSAKPRCGDGKLDGPGGDGLVTGPEQCDDGANNGAYGFCNNSCTGVVHCGDAILQSSHEQCDLGTGNFSEYAIQKDFSCKDNCTIGRWCGDAVLDDGRNLYLNTAAYYQFSEKTGASTADSSGAGNSGSIAGSRAKRSYGKYGRGIFFDDSHHFIASPTYDYVTTANPVVAATYLTLEAWIYPIRYPVSGAYSTIIEGTGSSYYMRMFSDGSLRTRWYGKSPDAWRYTAANQIPLNTWTHVAAVWSDTDVKLYINGVLKKTNTGITGTGTASTGTRIGGASVATQFFGIIDEVAFYTRAVDATELMTHVSGKTGNEYCDMGDADHGGGNLPLGTAITTYETSCSNICQWFHYCGDGVLDGPGGAGVTTGPEVCDDGPSGNKGEYTKCNPGCTTLGPRCGDGIKNGPEQCDKAPSNSDASGIVWDGTNDAAATCRTSCAWAICGDGIADTGEECDDGINNSNTIPNACRTNCVQSRCGDLILDSGEYCDDGNNIQNDSCNNCANPSCGDGIQKVSHSTQGVFTYFPNEDCDDGNNRSDDYCSHPGCTVIGYCGDGVIQTGHPASESCDNANFGSGIGAYCTGTCTGSGPTMTCLTGCTINHGACGDGNIDYIASEACDDNNSTNGDYCSYPSCQVTGYCGDGIKQVNEACDSADPSFGAGQGIGGYCINACQTNLGSCGDAKIQGPGYTVANYGGALPGTGTTSGPENCDINDARTNSLELNGANIIGCSTTCMRQGTCGDNIRQKRFEGCDDGVNNSAGPGGCHPGCKSNPIGYLDGASRTLINGWACDPDSPMNNASVRLEFYDRFSVSIDTRLISTSLNSEQAIQDLCGGGANHRWGFDPILVTWGTAPQPFTVKAYAVTPDGAPESDKLLGTRTFVMAQICRDGIVQRDVGQCGSIPGCVEIPGAGTTEQCDDGNTVNNDACRNDCKIPVCGDSLVTPAIGEVCELGATTACSSAGVPGTDVTGTATCATDCKSWVTANVCYKPWNCADKPYTYLTTESAWNTVSTYSQTWNGSAWVPADSTTAYNLTPSSSSCRYKCGTNFVHDGTKCVGSTKSFTCTAKPNGRQINSDGSYVEQAAGTLYNSASTYTQTWTWNSGINNYNWSPVEDPVTDYNTTVSSTECRYKCASGYHWNNTYCVKDDRTYYCNAKPANSVWNMGGLEGYYGQAWNGSTYLPADDPTTEYNIQPSSTECRFKCASGYQFDPFSNSCYAVVCGNSSIEIRKEELSPSFPSYFMGMVLGNATMGSGEIILTPASASQSGQYQYQYYDGPTLKYYNFGTRFVVAFDFYSGGGTNPGGDALYFYAYNSSTPGNEDVSSGGYIFAYDEYQDQLQVKWNGASVANATQLNLDNNRWNRAVIFVEEQSDGTTKIKMFVNKALKVNITDSARTKSGERFGFGARTGGATNQHKIKNIVVSGEVCDAGASYNNGTSYNGCASDCMSFGPACGNADTNTPPESCDTGLAAVDPSNWSLSATCDTACTWNRYCGDGTQDTEETCDKTKSYTYDALCDLSASGPRNYYSSSAPTCNSTCNGVGGTCRYCGDTIETDAELNATGCDSAKSYTAKQLCAKGLSKAESAFYDISSASCSSSCAFGTSGCYYCGDGSYTSSSGRVLWLNLNNNLTDSSGNSNTAYNSGGYYSTGNASVNNGNAFYVGGQNLWVNDSPSLDITGPMTVELWVNTSQSVSADPPAPILHKGTHASVLNYAMWLEPAKGGNPAGHVSMVFYINGSQGCGVHSSSAINNGAWHHVVGTYQSGSMKMYIDGALQATEACGLTPAANGDSLKIGWNGIAGYPYFYGNVDEIKIYNRTLTDVEVAQNFKEKCDSGASNGSYNACATNCLSWGPYCGDGTVTTPNEVCDGGNFNGNTCSTYGFYTGSLTCNSCTSISTSGCTNCGNGTIQSGEVCDGSNFNGLTCASYGFTGGSLSCLSCGSISTSGCYKECTHSIGLADTYGDGWNGARLDVRRNGANVLTGLGGTVTGKNVFNWTNFTVRQGETITTVYTAGGSYPSECYYRVMNAAGGGGTQIIQPATYTNGSYVAVCP